MNYKRLGTYVAVFSTATLMTFGCNTQPPIAETPPVEVVVFKPVKETIEDWDVFTGTLQSKEFVKITSRVRGHIEKVPFVEGTEIAEGDDLFILDSKPFKADLDQAEGTLKTWESKLTLAEERIKIYKPLADKGTVSREEYLSAVSAKGEALGSIDTAKGKITEAKTNIEYCRIKSPVNGRVGEAMLTKGNLVGASVETVLTTVVPVDPMYVKFNVNEQAFRNYERIMLEKATKNPQAFKDEKQPKVPVEMALLGDVGFPYKGIIDFVDNRVDPSTSSRMVRGEFKNPKGADGRRPLTAGMFARVRVSIAESYPAVLVAERAIQTDQSMKYVLVVNKEKKNVVERVDITPALRAQDTGLIAVTAGLKGDEWVIVEGVSRARPGMTVDPKTPKDETMPRRPVAKK
jgi:RND family efflux transporter MFP subunit